MEFGRSPTPASLNLPPFHLEGPRTRVLGQAPGRLRYGLPVWGCKEWVGDIYPTGTPTKKFLEAYGKRLGCVELNATHYSIPEAKTVQHWSESVPSEFRFFPKFPQSISHHRRLGELGDVRGDTTLFAERVLALGPRLGATFLQLPPLFTFADFPLLENFLRDAVPRELPISVELRHPTWFPRGGLAPAAFELFAELGVGTVISETPGRRDVVHASVPARPVLMRFLGTNGGAADADRVRAWVPHWKSWVEKGRDIALFLHLPNNDQVPRFLEQIERELVDAFGEYKSAPGVDAHADDVQLDLKL